MTEPPKPALPKRTKRTPEKDDGNDFLPDVDHFGEPLVFDEEGNVVSGQRPVAPPPR